MWDKGAVDTRATAKVASDKAAADKLAADQLTAKANADRVAVEKAAADKLAAEQLAAKANADKAAEEKAIAEKLAAEHLATAKLAAAKVATYRATLAPCTADGKCKVGNIGPGGGIVFYVAPTLQSWGQYLEVAPATWAGGYFDPYTQWCSLSDTLLATYMSDPEAIKSNSEKLGTGKSNTELMLSTCKDGVANLARNYHGGAKSDWYLPSADEVNQILNIRDVIADLSITSYWSSSLAPVYGAWQQIVYAGLNYTSDETNASSVRPIRAFG